MRIQILSKQVIKPITPTPPNLKYYKISLLDELVPTINIPLILYYDEAKCPNDIATTPSKCNLLKSSLAETLTKYYPLAGRLMKDNYTVDCGDQGAEFVEAHVNIRLKDLLNQGPNLKVEDLNNLLPTSLAEKSDPLLSIQVNVFDCGGLAIGLCIQHRLVDMSTFGTFVKAWAITASRVEGVDSISPIFNPPLFLPGGRGLTGLVSGSTEDTKVCNVATKIFKFNKATISSLRAKVTPQGSSKRQPSKVQTVCGVMWKALVDMNLAKDEQRSKDFIALEVVNLRERTIPPLSKYAFGNFCMLAMAKYLATENEMEFQCFVDRLEKAVKSEVNVCGEILSNGEEGQLMLINGCVDLIREADKDNVHAYLFSSWCNFPFYEADFGWGKPTWVSAANLPIINNVNLIDGKEGDGIEAWIHLEEKDMHAFEKYLTLLVEQIL